jgi:hypothetical protein
MSLALDLKAFMERVKELMLFNFFKRRKQKKEVQEQQKKLEIYYSTLLQYIENYDGTARGQKKIEKY